MSAATSRSALRFRLGNDVCHLDLGRVERVVPWVRLDPPPSGAPGPLAGWLTFHNELVPVIDLALWVLQKPTPLVFSSRIMVLRTGPGKGRRVGLLAEQLTDTNETADDRAGRAFDPDQVLVSLMPLIPSPT